jgi:hypothetical protein
VEIAASQKVNGFRLVPATSDPLANVLRNRSGQSADICGIAHKLQILNDLLQAFSLDMSGFQRFWTIFQLTNKVSF